MVGLFKKNESSTVRRVNKTWEKKFDDSAEVEITQNNSQVTSSSADDCRWGQCVCGAFSSIVDESRPITYTTSTFADVEIVWERTN